MTGLALALALLSAKPASASAGALAEVRAALGSATATCRTALQGRLPALDAALAGAGTPEGREQALQRLTDALGEADIADCSDAVRLALAGVRTRVALATPSKEPGPPADEEPDSRTLAIRDLEQAQQETGTKACKAAAGPSLDKWLKHLHGKKPAKPLAKELRAKARALAKSCPPQIAERLEAAAVSVLSAE